MFELLAGRVIELFAGRVFEFEFRKSVRFTLLRGVALTFSTPALALVRLMFAERFVLPFALAFAFAFSLVFFGRGFLGLFSLVLAAELMLRFSTGSSGVTVSGDSPSFVGRLMSIATV